MRELNYDEVLAPPKVKITIDGKVYEASQPSIVQIIDYERKVKELKEASELGVSGSEIFDKWIAVIHTMFSCIPKKVLIEKQPATLKKIAGDCTVFMQESLFQNAPEPEEEESGKVLKKK